MASRRSGDSIFSACVPFQFLFPWRSKMLFLDGMSLGIRVNIPWDWVLLPSPLFCAHTPLFFRLIYTRKMVVYSLFGLGHFDGEIAGFSDRAVGMKSRTQCLDFKFGDMFWLRRRRRRRRRHLRPGPVLHSAHTPC